jgi:menaquinone-specific isochorismate synthase
MPFPALTTLFQKARETSGPGTPARREIRLDEALDVLGWVLSYDVPERFYFRHKQGAYEIGGLGAAVVVASDHLPEVAAGLQGIWRHTPEQRVYGGMKFLPCGYRSPEWRGFRRFRFHIPLVEFIRTAEGLRVSVHGPGGTALDAALEHLEGRRRPPAAPGAPRITAVHDIPEPMIWNEMVSTALTEIQGRALDKIVLSRKKVLEGTWEIAGLMTRLAAFNDEAFVFLHQIGSATAFMGRSPERLFSLQLGCLETEAVAGTRPRGKTPEEDRRLACDLLQSPKELQEHRIVSCFMEERLGQHCRTYDVLAREAVVKLCGVQHIVTRYCGMLKNGMTPLEAVLSLHPTPAVGGTPTAHAMARIGACEPFERGCYAAPIGWMNRCEAEFAVGLRSALLNGQNLHVYAGAGIVAGSEPRAEWAETEQKMGTFLWPHHEG